MDTESSRVHFRSSTWTLPEMTASTSRSAEKNRGPPAGASAHLPLVSFLPSAALTRGRTPRAHELHATRRRSFVRAVADPRRAAERLDDAPLLLMPGCSGRTM